MGGKYGGRKLILKSSQEPKCVRMRPGGGHCRLVTVRRGQPLCSCSYTACRNTGTVARALEL